MSFLNNKGPIPMKVMPNPMPMLTIALHTNSNWNNNRENIIHATTSNHNRGRTMLGYTTVGTLPFCRIQ